jgi:hypothetical protein
MLIAIFLIDGTLGKTFDSQHNNKDIFQNDSRGKQCAKELLWSDQANFYANSLKSETNDTTSHTGIEPLSLSDFLDETTGLFQSMDYVPTFPTGVEPLGLSSSSNETTGLFQSMDYVPTSHTGIEPLSLSDFWDKTTGLFQSMDYVPTFPTGVEPLSLSSSSNKTNGLF